MLSFDDFNSESSSLQQQPQSDDLFSRVPSYLVAVDNHNVGSGNFSVLDPTSWGDGASELFKFSAASTVRAVTSTVNIVPTVANWFGADMEKVSTENWLTAIDDDLGEYYLQHQRGIDIVGDIVASFIPGIAGAKVLNWAQKGLAIAAEGNAGLGISKAFGLLPDKGQAVLAALGKLPGASTRYAELAAKEIAASSATFGWITGNTLKSLAAGYGQNALESAAFLVAGQAAMSDSPIFADQDAGDIAYNAILGGGLVGGGIMGAFTAAKTFGTIRKAIRAADPLIHEMQNITTFSSNARPADKILAGIDDLDFNPVLSESDPLYTQKFRALESRKMTLNNQIIESSHGLLERKDNALGNSLSDSIRMLDKDTAWQNLPGLRTAARVGEETTLEKELNKRIETALKQTTPVTLDAARNKALGSGAFNYSLQSKTGEDVGTLFYREGEKVVQAKQSFVNKEFQGQGIATEGYADVVNSALARGKSFVSDSTVSNDMIGVYRKLEALGYEVKQNPTAELSTLENGASGFKSANGKPVFTITKRTDIPSMRNGISVTYLKQHGEDAGRVISDEPAVLSIADIEKSPEAVRAFVASQKFKLADTKTPLTLASAQEAEARYIASQNWKSEDFFKTTKTPAGKVQSQIPIDSFDIPAVERMYELKLPTVTFKDGATHDLTAQFVENLKVRAATSLQELNPKMSTAEIAKRVNVRESYLNGVRSEKNLTADLFAMQGASEDLTKRMVEAGLWNAAKGSVNAWERPQYVKLVRDLSIIPESVDGNWLRGATYLKQQQAMYQQTVDNLFTDFMGDKADLFDGGLTYKQILDTDRLGAGASLLGAAEGNYGSAASTMNARGVATNTVQRARREAFHELMTPVSHAVLASPQASLELAMIRQQILSTPERMVLSEAGDSLIPAALRKMLATGEADEALMESLMEKAIPIKNPEVSSWLRTWVQHNDEYVGNLKKHLSLQGLNSNLETGVVYFPPPNPKDFKHFAFVVDPSITGTGHKKMIWASSDAELQQLANKVPTEFKVLYKADTEEFKRAMQEYEYSAGVNENYFNAAFARKGIAAPFFPKTDGAQLIQELNGWAERNIDRQVRDFVYTKYSAEYRQLEEYGNQYTKVATSTATGSYKYQESTVDNPYLNYIKTSLNLSTSNEIPLLSQANRLAETAVSKISSKLGEMFSGGKIKTTQDLEQVNAALKNAGVSAIDYDATMLALANHSAPKPVLLDFIRKVNGLFATTMLRADPMNALNNGLGANVLLGSESRSLIAAIRAKNPDMAGALSNLLETGVPGTGDKIISPGKLVAGAYKDWFSYVGKNPEAVARMEYFRKHGWLPSLMDQTSEMIGNLAPRMEDTAENLQSKLKDALAVANKNVDLWTGNRFAEEMNRFVAASTAKKITDLGIEAGVMTDREAISYINTFVNRTQGNYLASQRPLLFQGPIGQAIGLFQTYQFNLLQQFFRYVSDGQAKSAAILLGLQGSIYGMNGLPAFNAINTHIIGTAAGNTTNQDLYSATYDVAGKEAGDWLLYGAGSNFLGLLHPDLKTNLYSRGDINPRQVTVVPTSVADVPIVGFMSNIYGSIKKTGQAINAGADPWQAFLVGIEHSQISRPLAGFAQIAAATTNPAGKVTVTDNSGGLIASNDLFSLASLGRLTGARPMDEAVARDALFRMSVYKEKHLAEIATLGAAIRTKVQRGEAPSEQDLHEFMEQYTARGGDLKNFGKFYSKQIMMANKSKVNQMIDSSSGPYSQYLQRIMGGYELQDQQNFGDQ